MMSGHREICPDYIAGHCEEGKDCKFAHPEHDLCKSDLNPIAHVSKIFIPSITSDEEPISLSPSSFYPVSQNGVPHPLPIQAGHFHDALSSPLTPYYYPSSPPSSTTTSTSFSSISSPPVSPPIQRRKLKRRNSALRKELKLSVDTFKSERSYTPNRILDGRTLLEFCNTHTHDVHFVDELPLPELREPSEEESQDLHDLETREIEGEAPGGEQQQTEGGLFAPRFIVRPVSTPPTPASAIDTKRVVRLFSAEMP